MIDTCTKCGDKFKEERLLDLSHDIPKWMGGTDSDGRRYLCNKCHKNYDKKILNDCLNFIGLGLVEEPSEIIYWQKKLKGLIEINSTLILPFKDIARANKVRWFG